MKSLIQSSVLGGLTVFVWGMFSWMVLPWHSATVLPFSHDTDVVNVLDFATPQSGIFIYPGPDRRPPPANVPSAFVAFSKEGQKPMKLAMGFGLLTQILGAFLASWMLSKTQALPYGRKVLFVAVFGAAAGWLGSMPNWIWWNFPVSYTAISMADSVISWTLAGLVIAKNID